MMNATEKRATWSLSLIYAFRMFGLFMIFPVFVIYAQDIPGATPQTIGFALGVYGLTQALLQIPFGMASDKFGRKPIITIGLLLFALGSVLAALSDDMLGLIIGRAVQGSGAIAAAIMALASDVTREENRTKIMASIGISIGISFSVSLVMGPVFINWFSLSGLFWITAILSSLGIIILYLWVPTPSIAQINEQPLKQQLSAVLKNKQLLKLDVSIFVLHMILTSLFLVLPTLMVDAGLLKENHWQVYLPVLLLSFVIMIPFIIFAEKKKQITKVFLFAIALLAISLLSLYLYRRPLAGIVVSLLLFFCRI
jgi:MFS family permease